MESKTTLGEDLIAELLAQTTDPIQRRLIRAYQHGASLVEMESELGRIFVEVCKDEN